jgi:dihydrofolate reductase/thymidylate synthase
MEFNKQYLATIKTVLNDGEYVTGRNGVVLQYFCPNPIVVKDVSKEFPILSVRKIPFYKAALETFFFLSGKSSYEAMPEVLRNSWWEPWDSQAKAQGSWGRFYGSQWRHSATDQSTKMTGFDQWENLVQDLCNVVSTGQVNRKMVVSLWRRQDAMAEYTINPAVLDSCHSTALVFNLAPKFHQDELDSGYARYQEYHLDLHHTQRSLDLFLGTGSDLIYSGLIMQLLCNEVSDRLYNVMQPEHGPIVKPRKLVFSPSNCHLYENHIEQAKQLLMLNSNVLDYQPVALELKGPITDFSAFKTIEDVKEVASIRNYRPNLGDYKAELHG